MLECIGRVERSVTTIQQQIEFTRDYQNLGVFKPEWQDLSHLAGQLRTKNLVCRHNLDGLTVYADPMLRKVFENLVENTLRHGEHATTLQTSYRIGDGGATIFWEDDGEGVPDHLKERIFAPGFGRNTGYGLFLIREILAITGIGIRETGEPGRGARFEILVPPGMFRLLQE